MKDPWIKGMAHACVILVLVLLTLLIFDHLNPTMDFINNPIAKCFIALLCVLSFVVSLLVLAACHRKR